MLDFFRQRSRSWVSYLLVGAIAVTFAFWGVSNYLLDGGPQTAVAKVNGQDITQGQQNQLYERLRDQTLSLYGSKISIPVAFEKQLKVQALQQLITHTVLQQAALKAGFRISAQEINEAIFATPAFQAEGKYSPERFGQVLSQARMTPSGFMAQLRSELLADQARSGIIFTAFSLPNDIQSNHALLNQTRDLRYVILPKDRFAKEIRITPEQIETYFQAHQANFQHPEKVSIDYIKLAFDDLVKKQTVLPEALKRFYEENSGNYVKPARWYASHILIKTSDKSTQQDIAKAQAQLEKIKQQVEQGGRFSELAKAHSQDKASAKKGGELPWFSAGTFDPDFEKAVSALKEGEVSEVIQTKYGVELIKLREIEKSKQISFEKVKAQIQTQLQREKAQQAFADYHEQLSNLTFSNPDSLEPASKELGLTVQSTQAFTRDTPSQDDITKNPNIRNVAFSEDVLAGNNSDAIALTETSEVFLRVKNHVPATVKKLETVKKEIRSHLFEQAQQEKLLALGADLLKQLNDGQAQAVLAKKHDLKWENKAGVKRTESAFSREILALAFKLPHPDNDRLHFAGARRTDGDYVIVTVTKVQRGTIDEAQRDEQKRQIEIQRATLDYDLYVESQMKQAKIKVTGQ